MAQPAKERRGPRLSLVLLALTAASWLLPGGVRAGDGIQIGTTGANAGTSGVSLDVSFTHDGPIHAFSLAITFDPTYLFLRQITDEGTATALLDPEFFYPTINNPAGTAVLGVIFSYNDPTSPKQLEPSPDTPQKVAVLFFDIAPGAPPGDYPISLTNGIGSPPISNVFSREGRTIQPVLRGGVVKVNNENIFLMDSARVQPGARFEVKASAKHPASLQGYSLAFTYDKTILTFLNATYVGTAAAQAIRPQLIEFFQPQIELDFSPGQPNRARASVGAVLDFVAPFTGHEIPPSPSQFQSLVRVEFQSADQPSLIGTSTEIEFHNRGVSDVNNILIVDKQSYSPDLIHGTITFTDKPQFRRGFVNPDQRIDISDGIVILGHLFLGQEAPSCLASADVNDDERFDLSDAVALFNYLFAGAAPPREPFAACGQDPTPNNLSCVRSEQC